MSDNQKASQARAQVGGEAQHWSGGQFAQRGMHAEHRMDLQICDELISFGDYFSGQTLRLIHRVILKHPLDVFRAWSMLSPGNQARVRVSERTVVSVSSQRLTPAGWGG